MSKEREREEYTQIKHEPGRSQMGYMCCIEEGDMDYIRTEAMDTAPTSTPCSSAVEMLRRSPKETPTQPITKRSVRRQS